MQPLCYNPPAAASSGVINCADTEGGEKDQTKAIRFVPVIFSHLRWLFLPQHKQDLMFSSIEPCAPFHVPGFPQEFLQPFLYSLQPNQSRASMCHQFLSQSAFH